MTETATKRRPRGWPDEHNARFDEVAELLRGEVLLDDGRRLQRQVCSLLNPDIALGLAWGCLYRGPKKMVVLASLDLTYHGALLHVSVSYQGHNPSWKDLKLIKRAFFGPDTDVMIMLPKEADYVNVHQHTFHLWQTPAEWGLR